MSKITTKIKNARKAARRSSNYAKSERRALFARISSSQAASNRRKRGAKVDKGGRVISGGEAPATVSREPGERLTARQREQLSAAGRDIHGDKIEFRADGSDLLPEQNRNTVMSADEFASYKDDAKKKKRGLRKYIESQGWMMDAGADYADHKSWYR